MLKVGLQVFVILLACGSVVTGILAGNYSSAGWALAAASQAALVLFYIALGS